MGSHWANKGKGAFRAREAKVIKFTSALDLNTQTQISFHQIKAEFFKAANSNHPEKAIATLREKFNFVCPGCKKAGLVFSFGSQNPDRTINSIGGTAITGNVAHLKTKAGDTHPRGCTGVVIPSESHKIDDKKGYRIHLNLSTIPEYDPRSQRLIERAPGGRVIVLDPDLKERKPLSVRAVKDLMTPMRSGEIERLEKSVVVRGNRKISWSEFMIPATSTSGDTNDNLAQFARTYYRDHEKAHAVLINLDFKNCSSSLHQDNSGKSKSYYFPRTAAVMISGYGKVEIKPELLVQNEGLFSTLDKIQKNHGEVFVLAEDVFITKPYKTGHIHHMAVLLRDPAMIMEAKLEDIMATAQKRHNKSHPAPDLLTLEHS